MSSILLRALQEGDIQSPAEKNQNPHPRELEGHTQHERTPTREFTPNRASEGWQWGMPVTFANTGVLF